MSGLEPCGAGPEQEPRLTAVMPGKPTEGAGVKCSVRGARPFLELGPDGPRSTFDLLKVAGEWRCELHRERKR
jgi:hypothetical protein